MFKSKERINMRRYLYGGCEGLYEYIEMWKWIRKKGLENVYSLMVECFGVTWSMNAEDLEEVKFSEGIDMQ